MKTLIAILLCVMTLSGCAQMFTSKTTVTVEVVKKDGETCKAEYSSDKEQQGLSGNIDFSSPTRTGISIAIISR